MKLLIRIQAEIEVEEGGNRLGLQGALGCIEEAIDLLRGEGSATGYAELSPSKGKKAIEFTW